jgi:hypothetical protein
VTALTETLSDILFHKLINFALAVILLSWTLAGGEGVRATVSESRKGSLKEQWGSGVLDDAKSLTAEEKAFLLEHIRSLQENGFQDDAMLFRLGDEEITAKWIENWNAGLQRHAEVIASSGRPEIIVRLIPSLLKEEQFELLGTDIYTLTDSFGTAATILEIIKESGVFSIEVVRWSQGINLGSPLDQKEAWLNLRQGIRIWWNENESALRFGRYGDVKPGRPWESVAKEEMIAESQVPSAGGQVADEKLPTRTSEASRQDSGIAVYLFTVAAAIAMLILVAMWSQRRKV